MYVCEICHSQQSAGTPCKRIVTQTRPFHHLFRSGEPPKVPKGMPKKPSPVGEHWEWKEVYVDRNKKVWKWVWTWYDDPGGIGLQIVKEKNACPKCVH